MLAPNRKPMITCVAKIALVLGLGGCGDDGGGGGGDDTPDVDAEPTTAAVLEVDCAGATIAETITTQGNSYSPNAVTIASGEIVRFTPQSGHNVESTEDGLFEVAFAGEGCFRFDEPGSYGFFCTPHGFTGTVTVQ